MAHVLKYRMLQILSRNRHLLPKIKLSPVPTSASLFLGCPFWPKTPEFLSAVTHTLQRIVQFSFYSSTISFTACMLNFISISSCFIVIYSCTPFKCFNVRNALIFVTINSYFRSTPINLQCYIIIRTRLHTAVRHRMFYRNLRIRRQRHHTEVYFLTEVGTGFYCIS